MRLDHETIAALEWDRVRQVVAAKTSSALARRTLEGWEPRDNVAEAREALGEVTEGMDLAEVGRLPAPFVEDQSPTLRILAVEGATLDGRSLIDAARTLEATRRSRRSSSRSGFSRPSTPTRGLSTGRTRSCVRSGKRCGGTVPRSWTA
jgi:dsDNA-specific endonuclease/ATPase MutS2